MLAVGGTSCISLVSVAAADENSLTPLHRLLPAETASLGFGGSPVGGGNKNSCFAFFRHFCVGGGITTLWPLCLCRNNPARGLFQQKKRLSQSGCSAPTDTLFPPAHSAFSAFLHGGGIITLWPLCLCRNNPARGLFRQKNGFLRVGALRRRTSCSLLHTVLFWHLYAWGGITTLGARFMPLKRWTPAGHGGVFTVFMPSRNSPCVG